MREQYLNSYRGSTKYIKKKVKEEDVATPSEDLKKTRLKL
jgi:hypothetical protein